MSETQKAGNTAAAAIAVMAPSFDRMRPEPNITGIVPGGTGILKISDRALVHSLEFRFHGGLLPSHITGLTVLLDSQVIMKMSGTYLADIFNVYKDDWDPAVTGTATLDFANPMLPDPVEATRTAIPVGNGAGVGTLEVQFEIDDAAPAAGKLTVKSQVGPLPVDAEGRVIAGAGSIPRVISGSVQGIEVNTPIRLDKIVPARVGADSKKRMLEKLVFDLPYQNIAKIEILDGEQTIDTLDPVRLNRDQAAAGRYFIPTRQIIDKVLRSRIGAYRVMAFENLVVQVTLQESGAYPLPANLIYTAHLTGALH
ncbi:major capsid protein P2 [Parvularcula sp. LCG005]|uniref:major capsid protein P2 n=1 Tax=Parvularcula sp. LCG005 TaxID=3078805 RepID=UPI002943779E|nr:major capsid protein P2 [Parvularcula sp. LCG005]WOI51970.1 major capsid protein P2 [Parvularcula sp. LCG005]